MQNEVLILIDCYAIFFKSFYAFQNLKTKSGIPIGAVSGFIRKLLELLSINPGTLLSEIKNISQTNNTNFATKIYVGIAIDYKTKNNTFRHKIYADYKSTRKPLPDELRSQISIMYDLIHAINIPILQLEGFEADDIIASSITKFRTKASKEISQNYQAYVVSQDKDLMQLISKDNKIDVLMWDPYNKHIVDENKVIESLGVTPAQIPCFLGLLGDASDNIPGVSGIGKKTASNLLMRFGSLENISPNCDKITGKRIIDGIMNDFDNAILSKRLAQLKNDIDIELDYNGMEWNGWNDRYERLLEFLTIYNLEELLYQKAIQKEIRFNT